MKTINLEKSKELYVELGQLIYAEPNLSYNSPLIKDTNFYKEMQTTEKLIANNMNNIGNRAIFTKMIWLITKIAGEAPLLKEACFRESIFPEFSEEVSFNLAASTTLNRLDMSNNHLGQYGIKSSAALITSSSITFLDFSENNLQEHAPTVAKNFARSVSIKLINMTSNCHDFVGGMKNQPAFNDMVKVFADLKDINISNSYMTRELKPYLIEPLTKIIAQYIGHTIICDTNFDSPRIIDNNANDATEHALPAIIGDNSNDASEHSV